MTTNTHLADQNPEINVWILWKAAIVLTFKLPTMNENDLIKACIKAQAIYDANNTCLSVAECAKWLRVHNDTILRRLQAGKIKGNLIGRVWSIPKIQFLDRIMKDLK